MDKKSKRNIFFGMCYYRNITDFSFDYFPITAHVVWFYFLTYKTPQKTISSILSVTHKYTYINKYFLTD